MVRGKKMKNPLRKRLPRELKTEFGKYLVIFLLLVATIGLVSGFLVADGSMIIAYNEGFEKYNVEKIGFPERWMLKTEIFFWKSGQIKRRLKPSKRRA